MGSQPRGNRTGLWIGIEVVKAECWFSNV